MIVSARYSTVERLFWAANCWSILSPVVQHGNIHSSVFLHATYATKIQFGEGFIAT